jgi:amidase
LFPNLGWIVSLALGIMVSAWFLAKAILAVAPLTSVYAQYSAPSSLPLLLDATTEELALGLEAGNFTSVDLVNVNFALLSIHYSS